MAKRIITISREFGSGEEVAKELGTVFFAVPFLFLKSEV